MFFIASKLVETALFPSNIIGFLAILGLIALILRRRRTGTSLVLLSAVFLIIAGWLPLGPAVVMVLEGRFPIPELPSAVTGIVMLGGAVDTHITSDRNSVALNDNSERIFAVAALARRYPQARILLSGGANHLLAKQSLSESEVARRVLVEIGVPFERIEMEERSRTTFENATESVSIAKPKAGDVWLLVTSAYNMPRAVACFQAVEFPITPYPVDFRTRPADLRQPVRSIADGLTLTDVAAHEWLGLFVYRITGRTQSLSPGL